MIVKGTTDFTPGPWSWWTSNSVKRLTAQRGQDGGVLSAVRCSDGVADIEVSEADARLIAAAPELLAVAKTAIGALAAARYLVTRYAPGHSWLAGIDRDIDSIKSVVAAATKESA